LFWQNRIAPQRVTSSSPRLITVAAEILLALTAQVALLEGEVERFKSKDTKADSGHSALLTDDRAKRLFAAQLRHEAKLPLNAMLLASQQLAHAFQAQPPNHEYAQWLEIIQQFGDHLTVLLDDMGAFLAQTVAPVSLSLEPMSPVRLLNPILEVSRFEATKKGLAFCADISPHLPRSLLVDSQHLTQVLFNLLNNAIKFTDAGYVAFRVKVNDHHIRFQVEDTGIGIAAQELEAIFLPLRRGSNAANILGSGLGLAIANQWVHQMGGNIGVESTLGKGSVFWFDLPLLSAEA
jgi:signal transduction histidine kinase